MMAIRRLGGNAIVVVVDPKEGGGKASPLVATTGLVVDLFFLRVPTAAIQFLQRRVFAPCHIVMLLRSRARARWIQKSGVRSVSNTPCWNDDDATTNKKIDEFFRSIPSRFGLASLLG
jgi:hypothetical protein